MSDWMDKYSYKCGYCGKEHFILDPKNYVYKIPRNTGDCYFCSYKCFRTYQKENPIRKYSDVVR